MHVMVDELSKLTEKLRIEEKTWENNKLVIGWRIRERNMGKMEKVKERNLVVDVVRGIAVLAVLVAHSQQRGLYSKGILYPNDLLTKLIYPWYMPIFVFVSGYVLYWGGAKANLRIMEEI